MSGIDIKNVLELQKKSIYITGFKLKESRKVYRHSSAS